MTKGKKTFIYPSTIDEWHKDPNRIKDGQKVPDDFVYSSGNNAEWMTIEELQSFFASDQYQELVKFNL